MRQIPSHLLLLALFFLVAAHTRAMVIRRNPTRPSAAEQAGRELAYLRYLQRHGMYDAYYKTWKETGATRYGPFPEDPAFHYYDDIRSTTDFD